MEELSSYLDEVILTIQNSSEYQICLSLKEKMKDNSKINTLVSQVKTTQKKYIRSHYDSIIKKELDSLEEQLLNIPIYHIYFDNLQRVNEMIHYVQDTLNQYFYQLLNKKN